jgi:hypothetical protein
MTPTSNTVETTRVVMSSPSLNFSESRFLYSHTCVEVADP